MLLYMFESVLFVDPLNYVLFFNFPSLVNSFGLNIVGNLVFNNSLFMLLILSFYVTLLNVYLLFQSSNSSQSEAVSGDDTKKNSPTRKRPSSRSLHISVYCQDSSWQRNPSFDLFCKISPKELSDLRAFLQGQGTEYEYERTKKFYTIIIRPQTKDELQKIYIYL